MDSIKHFLHEKAISVAETLMPDLKESKFRETGVITPEEFVLAGDHLVHHCPTWQWGVADSSMLFPYLPNDKQFLITRNVPCYKRVKQMCTHRDEQEKVIDDDDGDGGWVDTHHFADPSTGDLGVSDLSISHETSGNNERGREKKTGISKEGVEQQEGGVDDVSDNSSEEAGDMEMELGEDGNLIDDDQVVQVTNAVNDPSTSTGILQTRTYDLHITYAKYYRTPRVWLYGYDENCKPLSKEQMYEDISRDHVNKTVTMEMHPHIQAPAMISVHPCKHAEVMKRIIETVADGGGELQVYMYLLIFLKFLQAVFPTIEYDFTRNVRM